MPIDIQSQENQEKVTEWQNVAVDAVLQSSLELFPEAKSPEEGLILFFQEAGSQSILVSLNVCHQVIEVRRKDGEGGGALEARMRTSLWVENDDTVGEKMYGPVTTH